MIKCRFLLALLSIAFAVSCSNEDVLEEALGQQIEDAKFTDAELAVLYQMRGESRKVDMNEAVRYANDVIGFLDKEAATRSGNARSIRSVSALTTGAGRKAVTRTADGETMELPDTVAYLFNFGEDEGFVIVSADKRIDSPILGYCGNGSLKGEIDNPGLAGTLMETEDYIVNSIANYENRKDSMTYEILAKLALEDSKATRQLLPREKLLDRFELYIDEVPRPSTTITNISTNVGGWVTTAQVQPLLPVEWNQGNPFNKLVKNKNGCTNAPTGCVATALAQLMAYWQYPTNIGGYNLNWPLLRNYTARPGAYPNVMNKGDYRYVSSTGDFATQVSCLMERIGDKVGMNYGDGGSGASSSDAILLLLSSGYTADCSLAECLLSGGLRDYDYNAVIGSLNNSRPVYTTGYAGKIKHTFLGITMSTTYSDGHAWIIDGYLNQCRATIVEVTVRRKSTGAIVSRTSSVTYSYADYLHHNWGWGGSQNGYFVAGSFASQEKQLESVTRSTGDYNYEYNKKVCTNIKH